MVAFPESTTRKPLYGYDNTPDEKVRRTPPEAGNEYERDLWGKMRFRARCEFLVSKADAKVLWDFYTTHRINGTFTFFDFEEEAGGAVTLGTGTGSQQTYSAKSKLVRNVKVFINGVETTAFSISYGTGVDGQDQIVFSSAPANGTSLTLTGDLRRMYTCKFAEKPTRRSVSFNRVLISMLVHERFPLAA